MKIVMNILSIAAGGGLLVALWWFLPVPEILWAFVNIIFVPVIGALAIILVGVGGYNLVAQAADGWLSDMSKRWRAKRDDILNTNTTAEA